MLLKENILRIVIKKTFWESCCRKHFGCPGKITVSGLEGGDKEGFRLTLFAQFILITMMKTMMKAMMKAMMMMTTTVLMLLLMLMKLN